jgi:hypothetical protein
MEEFYDIAGRAYFDKKQKCYLIGSVDSNHISNENDLIGNSNNSKNSK